MTGIQGIRVGMMGIRGIRVGMRDVGVGIIFERLNM